MAKYYGTIGYIMTVEDPPESGIWAEKAIERKYYGDTIEWTSKHFNASESTNDNIDITNQISVLADAFAYQNFQYIKYVEYMGAKWKVSSVKVQRPRLILSTGGVYNGEQA